MGKTLDAITPDLKRWLEAQHAVFVATAPLAAGGRVNCSPKGGDTFRVLGEREVAYLDLTGSGIETIAHLQENGRIVLMFCAFSGPPKIARLHGTGTVIYPTDPQFADLANNFPAHTGARAIIRVAVTRVSTSCGFGVPQMEFLADRDELENWSTKKGPAGLDAYRQQKNSVSIDQLSGYEPPRPPRKS
jgi:hypothetical protein